MLKLAIGHYSPVIVGLFALALVVNSGTSCVVRQLLIGRTNTGTCEGACDRYMECREGGTSVDEQRCTRECPEALSDPESIRAFESLSCEDVAVFVDGPRARPRR
jgi:hypothetical protein